MRRLVVVILTILVVINLNGCGYEETKEYDIVSARAWEEKEETGTFTTKVNTTTYIEVIYQTEEGFKKIDRTQSNIYIDNYSKVIHEEGRLIPRVYMTSDYYNSLLD